MQKDEDVEFYRNKFAGSQADRIVKAEAEAKKLADKVKETKLSGHIFPLMIIYVQLFYSVPCVACILTNEHHADM